MLKITWEKTEKNMVNTGSIKESINKEFLKGVLIFAKFIKWTIFLSLGMSVIITVIAFTKAISKALGGM